jgi:glycosyltransferase involved in cell wall biosynthesis
VRQTCKPFEVIVVDDCSTDNTVEVVKGFPDSLVRCIVLETNTGAQAARNRGIHEARGEWIAFQDSDDEWLPDKLEKQLASLAVEDFDPMTVIHGDCFVQNHQAEIRTTWHLPLVHGANVYPLLLKTTGPVFPSILTSKAALEAIDYLDELVPSYQEWDTSIRLASICRFIHLRDPLFVYHLHGGETISKNMKRDVEGYQYIVDKFRNDILQHCGARTLDSHLCSNARKALMHGYFQEAEEILSKTVGDSVEIRLLKGRVRKRSYPGTLLSIHDRIHRILSAI